MKSLDFLIVGAQKSGTTALAHFLGQHPDICMAEPKECHVFDDPDYGAGWSREDIDRFYEPFFAHCSGERLRGEATPAYMFYEDIAAELARYRPELKLVVILRDPVERAISHYLMERTRGHERLPLWLALLAEQFLGRNGGKPRAPDRAYGRYCYRKRGLYSGQLRRLYRHFPGDRVLVLRQADLHHDHANTLAHVFDFLGVSPEPAIAAEIVRPKTRIEERPAQREYRLLRRLLRLSYYFEYRRLAREPGIAIEKESR